MPRWRSTSDRSGAGFQVEVFAGLALARVDDLARDAAAGHGRLERLAGGPLRDAHHPAAVPVEPRTDLEQPRRPGGRLGHPPHARVHLVELARGRVVHRHEDVGHAGVTARHSRMLHLLTTPCWTNGSPEANSSAASRVVKTAIEPPRSVNGPSESSTPRRMNSRYLARCAGKFSTANDRSPLS